ncbi:protein of unknown function [Micromonospora echinaurantiaca]|uniref:Protein-glutamine gamma-glutamyltransferase-like C-terminal domain-containing protein n=1 Tax=Micromonospora echinaurantiaca TaxID=47857 RepID=A0A1C5JSX9_9ACTN|nr:DUF4129 domain-containing protein [Micromonospora echinaurantiaca]SCG73664.1 protein of unknown function [Micromonospora echinaurantiaca]
MSFSRWWTETTASLGDRVPLPLAALLLVLAAATIAVAWYTYPAWVPRRLPRLRRRKARRERPRPATAAAPAVPAAREPVDEPPAAVHLSLADRLAAEGRYAEAVRERLRGMLRELVTRRMVRVRSGMTVTEVIAAASEHHPPAGPPLRAAGAIFSELWYAERPATAEHDRRMREHAGDLHRALAEPAEREDRP